MRRGTPAQPDTWDAGDETPPNDKEKSLLDGASYRAVGTLSQYDREEIVRTMPPPSEIQTDLIAWARELEQERERVAHVNAERANRRGYLVFATDRSISPEEPAYREVYATEAKTPNQAMAKVRPVTEGRRLSAYLATGRYRDELAEARWVA